MNPVFDLSPRLTVLPIVHGSAEFALLVRRHLRRNPCDCLAVPLPPAFAAPVETGVEMLPRVSIVLQPELPGGNTCSMVPVEPSQGVVTAIRQSMEAGVPRAYVDLEVAEYEPYGMVLPDPFALKQVPLERFAAAVLPYVAAPDPYGQRLQRIRRMAYELPRLELDYEHVLCVCSILDWPWLRQAYVSRAPFIESVRPAGMPRLCTVPEEDVFFVLGELPFITHLYEHRRAELLRDETLAMDGVKALLREAGEKWRQQSGSRDWNITTKTLGIILTYARNLTLMDRRLTPDLYHLALAAKQVVSDGYALALIQLARRYPAQCLATELEIIRAGPDACIDAAGQKHAVKNRLQGAPRIWKALALRPPPAPPQRRRWQLRWNPLAQCSYPPEDERIESFQRYVRQQARMLLGDTEARTERFTASMKDGLDIRETMRNWHKRELYVRELPPARGDIEVVVFLFDAVPDPGAYPWRTTWYAEHEGESTLCFFATRFMDNMVGPGIGQALYGGCFFIYPPRPIADVWRDNQLDFARSPAERLVAGALFHSRERYVALVSPFPPPASWRRLARRLQKQFVHIPLQRFSSDTIDRLRRFHVLNGRLVRSYAARFIRDPG